MLHNAIGCECNVNEIRAVLKSNEFSIGVFLKEFQHGNNDAEDTSSRGLFIWCFQASQEDEIFTIECCGAQQ